MLFTSTFKESVKNVLSPNSDITIIENDAVNPSNEICSIPNLNFLVHDDCSDFHASYADNSSS